MSLYSFEVQIPGRNFIIKKDDVIMNNITSFKIKCDVQRTIPELEITYGKNIETNLNLNKLSKDVINVIYNEENGDIKIYKNDVQEKYVQSIEIETGTSNIVKLRKLLVSEKMIKNKM